MGRDPINPSKKLQAINRAKDPKQLERALQVLLLLSILSFLLSNSSCLHNINLSSTKAFLSNYQDYFIDRKAIFLFFNAILLFLVKDSGFLSNCSSPVQKPYDEFLARKIDHRRPPKTEAMDIEADVAQGTKASGHSLDLTMIEERRDEGMAATGIKELVVEEKAVVESGSALELVLIEEGDEEAMELVGLDEMKDGDIDELNRRFEEFIERVKRERRREALQLVMVYDING